MRATVKIFHNKYQKTITDTYPITIEVYYHAKRRYYQTGVKLKPSDFKSKKPTSDKNFVQKKYADAVLIVEKLGENFSFETFERLYYTNKPFAGKLSDYFDEKIESLEIDRIGTKQSYTTAKVSFLKYHPNALLKDITPKWLRGYEDWMTERGRSKTTVGIHARSLRAIFNDAKRNKVISEDSYPFGKGKYEIPTGKKTNKALTIKEIEKLFKYKAKNSTEEKCLDYFIFLYLCNGLNVSDFCRLKWVDLKEDTITFIREKTKRTKREVKPIEINLLPRAKTIIEKYGDSKNVYIFPHLYEGMTYEQQDKISYNLARLINDYIKLTAKNLNINKEITTYYARHSFATILKNSGAPISMISELLGHSSITTTEAYIASFESEQVKKATKALINF